MKSRFPKLTIVTRGALIRLAVLGIVLGLLGVYGWFTMLRMPGESYKGPLPPASRHEQELAGMLKQDVQKLAGDIGERNVFLYPKLAAAADFLEASLKNAGYTVRRQGYEVEGKTCSNLEVEIKGAERPDEIVVVGAHYDSVIGSPGANDNATGAAAVLAMARTFRGKKPARTLRFVEFVNEEPPFFQTSRMGSLVYARECRSRGEKIVAMFSLETMGYYSDREGSQHYPPIFGFFYPSRADFITLISNPSSKQLLRKAVGLFRKHAKFSSEGIAMFELLPGINWSDHWSFWRQGYPAVMVTDTAFYRYSHYHTDEDTPEKVDYDRLARVTAGLEGVMGELVGVDLPK